MIVEEDQYLEHFGILGMKWGVRRDLDKQGRRDARAQKHTERAARLQSEINAMDVKISEIRGFNLSRGHKIRQRRELHEERRQALRDAELKRQGKLSTTQKKVAIGVGATAAILAAWGTYASLESGQMRRLAEMGKQFVTRDKGSVWKAKPELANPKMSADQILSKVVKPINPEYGKIGTKMNCRRATFAYEMRRRGHDVMATRSTRGRGQNAPGVYNALSEEGTNLVPSGIFGSAQRVIAETFKGRRGGETPVTNYLTEGHALGAKIGIDDPSPDSIFRTIQRQGNGARGELAVEWSFGGGHSMAWEVIDNKPVIFDTQTGKRFNTGASLLRDLPDIGQAGLTRLDNVPLNENFLLRWVRNAN